jgi:DNA-binding beta-propeller fold protein YncE
LDRLFIVDSEINEVTAAFDIVQANLFETPPAGGSSSNQWDTTENTGAEPEPNREPTGITYCVSDGHFYVSNDDSAYIYRYSFDGTNLTAIDAVSTSGIASDPEGITCDPGTGRIYVIGGVDLSIVVYSYDSGFVLEEIIDLPATARNPNGVPADAEGIAFDPGSGHLFVVSDPDKAIFEYDLSGTFVQKFDISGFLPSPIAPQGLSIGPSSANPQQTSFYIADGMVDNDVDPNERDGRIFEAIITRMTN